MIGFVGLGAMGAPMARRLASLGHELVVHDVDSRAVRSVVDAGAWANLVSNVVTTYLPAGAPGRFSVTTTVFRLR